ncbi:SIMPL domain-containing protein [Halomicrobium salinisoli]|uniref:SIMPL domain-containing protein n=1 Tax=Halomicrobium salinisoli TaxID=2878391 RepID=UPI001CEFEE74|nr:SIMPL domain-containing protein [Halomicrobium salinisoli]
MQRRELLAATAGAAAAAVSGCLGMDGNDGSAAAQTGTPTVERRTSRSIVVSNTGETRGDPDLAVLHVGVEASGDTAGDVRDELATRAEELRQALLDFGLEEDAVTTEDFHIRERHDRRAMEEDGVRPGSEEADEYVTYRGTHAFRVEVAAIDDVGAVIDAAVDGGADQVGRVTFTLSDEKRATLREEALRGAIQGARDEAETVADEIGASIVEATVVDTAGGGVTPVEREVSYAADAAATETPGASTGVEPGEVTVSASVQVRYAIE